MALPAPPTERLSLLLARLAAFCVALIGGLILLVWQLPVQRVTEAYPGLTSQQERSWRDFFQLAQNLRVSFSVTELQQSVDAAEATVNGAIEYRNAQSRRDERQPIRFRAQLERRADGWRILAIHE